MGLPFEAIKQMMEIKGWQVGPTTQSDFAKQVVEITTYRTEHGYTDRRRPDKVAWGKTLAEDLSRRDFTINAMAMKIEPQELQGRLVLAKKRDEALVQIELIGPYGGEADLEAKLIKAVRDPQALFEEDALRMLRAIRIGAQLGFNLEKQTLEAISLQANLINQMAMERIRDEFLKILISPFPADGVRLLEGTGLLKEIMPELLAMRGIRQAGHHRFDVWTHSLEALKACPSSDPIVRLATLLHDVGKPVTYREQGPRGVTFYGHEVAGARMAKTIGQRLRLSRKEIDRLYILVRWHMFAYTPNMTDAAIRRFIRRVGLENINEMMLLRVGDRVGGGSRTTSWRLRELQQRIGEQLYEPLNLKDLKVNGTEVMAALHLTPGPPVGKILNQLFEEVLEDPSLNEKEKLLRRAKELAAA